MAVRTVWRPSFAEWSRAVDQGSIPKVRAWLAAKDWLLNSPVVVEAHRKAALDLAIHGRSAVFIGVDLSSKPDQSVEVTVSRNTGSPGYIFHYPKGR